MVLLVFFIMWAGVYVSVLSCSACNTINLMWRIYGLSEYISVDQVFNLVMDKQPLFSPNSCRQMAKSQSWKNLPYGQALDAVRFLPSLHVHTFPHADTPSRTHCPLQLGSSHAYWYSTSTEGCSWVQDK